MNVKSIITDISPIGCLVGNKLNLPVLLISNFTWVEQYEFMKIEDSIIKKFRQAYSIVTKFIKYDLCLPVSTIHCNEIYDAGFICRKINYNKAIEEKDLSIIDILSLEKQLKNNIDYKKLNSYKNNVDKVVHLILS